MKRHAAASNLLLSLLVLELVPLGQGNRLPYFINYFFDTYLLINEDTPVGLGQQVLLMAVDDLTLLSTFIRDQRIFLGQGGSASPCTVQFPRQSPPPCQPFGAGPKQPDALAPGLTHSASKEKGTVCHQPVLVCALGWKVCMVPLHTGVLLVGCFEICEIATQPKTKSEFTVEFSVSDSQGVIKGTVNIQVGDVNDNAPQFHNQPYSVRIPENTPVGTPIFIVNATDPDQGAGGSVLYSFQPPSSFFAIDSGRGIVSVIRELDYEVTQAYQLQVNATDQDKNKPLSTLANLAITITDVQDMDPIFINLPYSTNIYENSPPGTTVRMITAIDQDKGRPRGIGYTIVSGKSWPAVGEDKLDPFGLS
ncbi:hypothetical protein ASZ78_004160 [Callipepla squamata]|uniref:Cadherin domain-containing protein n=1 Tax=Callipepla squamata TaxID=9009 RepID=A0A226N8E1_CALSU|nr:hypothetical protein ASZ78_004160 [Callipepla squamata]